MADIVSGKPAALRGMASYIVRELLTVPNAFTAYRFSAGIVIAVLPDDLGLVLALAISGALADAVDGYLARLLNQQTRFGRAFDQVSDFVFGFALVYAIFRSEGPTWYNLPVMLALGGFGAVMLYLRLSGWVVTSSAISKKRIALQFGAAIVIILAEAFPKRDSIVLLTLAYGVLWYTMYLMSQTLKRYWYKLDE